MSEPLDQTPYDELDESLTRRLHELFSRLYDEVITVEEVTELNQLLYAYPEARRLYLRHVSLHNMLLARQGKQQCFEAEALNLQLTGAVNRDEDSETCGVAGERVEKRRSAGSRNRTRAILCLAASLALVAATVVWAVREPHEQPRLAATPDVPAKTTPPPQEGRPPLAARLSYISPDARWQRPNEAYAAKASVPNGSVLTLAAGQLEMTYHSGTRLLLIGPAEFVLEPTGGKLLRGGLVAAVTEAGHGFTIETPHGRVVDLGTEFGVAVDDFGVSEVSVFQGVIEAFPQADVQELRKIQLTKGRGLQWDRDNFLALDADPRRFAAVVLEPEDDSPIAEERTVLEAQFQDAAPNSRDWKTHGKVQTSKEGLRMLGEGAEKAPPYLISAQQFDPAQGVVTVTCDLRFADIGSAEGVAFSVLTRATDERGIALPPWNGTLSSCARCSLSTSSDAIAGVLQTGVKLATDRELTGISWSGFLPPAPNTPYRVVMRDDGVNLTFTVSLRDQPSSSKTVTCRSLFRGKRNFVALEGSRVGVTLIDEVKITQEPAATPLSNYADFSSFLNRRSRQAAAEKRLLASWAPTDVQPVIQDDFDDVELDKQRWASMGEIEVRGGALHIGRYNADGHIDTWKARPYLLSRRSLDPREGKVTITGRITFAQNFLSGYGATFAVMTRADASYGAGPGWESSVLGHGVRASLWPAAWDRQRTLEIHERSADSPIALLATRDWQVDPQTRSYLFRAIDDGLAVSFTLIDPRHPDLQVTISTQSTLVAHQGLVGFESCWGSPVTLDDICIFQESSSAADAADRPRAD